MADYELTMDAKTLIEILYAQYLRRRMDDLPKLQAGYFGDSSDIQKELLPDWHPEDVATTCWELHNEGLLACSPGDNIANNCTILPRGVIYMEQLHKGGLDSVIESLRSVGVSVATAVLLKLSGMA